MGKEIDPHDIVSDDGALKQFLRNLDQGVQVLDLDQESGLEPVKEDAVTEAIQQQPKKAKTSASKKDRDSSTKSDDRISVRINTKDYNLIKAAKTFVSLTEHENLSTSALIRRAVEEYMAKRTKKGMEELWKIIQQNS